MGTRSREPQLKGDLFHATILIIPAALNHSYEFIRSELS